MFTDTCGKMTTSFADIASVTVRTSSSLGTGSFIEKIFHNSFFFFALDFITMLNKHLRTQVLSSDFKKTLVYFNWNFLIYWSAILTLKS